MIINNRFKLVTKEIRMQISNQVQNQIHPQSRYPIGMKIDNLLTTPNLVNINNTRNPTQFHTQTYYQVEKLVASNYEVFNQVYDRIGDQIRNQIKYTIMIVGLSEYIYRKLEEDGNN